MTVPPAAPLSGRAVLVTGASSGIGRAIALACARAGADLAVTFRENEAGARETARAIVALGRRCAVLPLDLTREDSLQALGPAVREALGRIDVWINNAGADILTGDADRLTPAQKLDVVLAVDLRGTVLASWQAVEIMNAQPEGGAIINMSWDHVGTGMAGLNPQIYSAVKGGVMSFSKSLARTVAPHVRVNILAPGWIETSFGANADDEWRRSVAESTPLKRWGLPEDVAGAAVFLASPSAAFLTGQAIFVGGGVAM